jgi:hypothetical protein
MVSSGVVRAHRPGDGSGLSGPIRIVNQLLAARIDTRAILLALIAPNND